MSDIFLAVPGRAVLAATNTGTQGLMLSLPDQGSLVGIVTQLGVSQEVAAQMQPSLDGTFYITSFGDAPGSLSVKLLLNSRCDGTDPVSSFMNYYSDNRLKPSTSSPSVLAIGASAFSGYVTGFTMDASSENGHIITGTLRFVVWLAQ